MHSVKNLGAQKEEAKERWAKFASTNLGLDTWLAKKSLMNAASCSRSPMAHMNVCARQMRPSGIVKSGM